MEPINNQDFLEKNKEIEVQDKKEDVKNIQQNSHVVPEQNLLQNRKSSNLEELMQKMYDRLPYGDPFYDDDTITPKIIKIYRKFIFSIDINNKEQLNKIIKLDSILASYFDDYDLRKKLNVSLKKMKVKKSEENVLNTIVDNIINLYDKYIEDYTRNIYIPRWI